MNSNEYEAEILELRREIAELKCDLVLERKLASGRGQGELTEGFQSEEALQRVHRQLRMISDANHALIRATDEMELLDTVCTIATGIGGYRMAWVGYADDDASKTVHLVAFAGIEDGYLQNIKVTWSDEDESGRGPMGTAIRTRLPCPIQNVAKNPQFGLWRVAALERGYTSVCGLPLVAGNQTLGALGIYSSAPDAFDTEEVTLLSELATDLAFGIAVMRTRQEHKLAAQALAASEVRFKRLVQNSNDIIATTDANGVQTSVSGPVERILGYLHEELIGTSAFDRMHAEDVEAIRKAFAAGLTRPLSVPRFEYRYRHKNGEWIYLEAVGANRLNDPSFGGIVLNIRDISDRKKGERERDKLHNQLQQAMKMEAVGRLAGGIAHDFNNLLTVITGNVELAKLTLRSSDPLVQQLDEVMKASRSAAALTRQLLSFSRQQIIEPRIIDLNELVDNLQKMLTRLIGENIELQTRLASDLCAVSVDPGQFEQVLVNLVVNARDAMQHGGKLLIETSNLELDQEHCDRHPNTEPGQFVMLAVSDTGHGMSEAVKLRLFEPFFTTKPKGQGTGLGLATIFGAVKQAGGFIEAYSEVGTGSAFKIYLPRVEEPAQKLGRTGPGPDIPRGTETVLLVEDEESVRELACALLKRLGYTVQCAANGGEALMLVKNYDDPIDLLMTDVVMPGINGRELAERISIVRPAMKVLFTSGYTENIVVHHGIVDEDLNFIGKPYSLEMLARKLRAVLEPTQK